MNVNVYLPNDLGERAKALPRGTLSQLLQAAVVDELERRAAVSTTLDAPHEYLLALEDQEGRSYDARLIGKLIAYDEAKEVSVYLTDDERVILHNPDTLTYWELDNAEEELREQLNDGAYVDAMHALGIKPVIDF